MPGALPVDLERRDIQVGLCDADLIIFLNRFFDPWLERVGDRHLGLELSAESLQIPWRAADDARAAKRACCPGRSACRDLLGDDLIVLGLSVVGVGDRRGADFEIALGLGQVLAHRRFLAFGQLDVEPGQKHVEIGLYHSDDEILLR